MIWISYFYGMFIYTYDTMHQMAIVEIQKNLDKKSTNNYLGCEWFHHRPTKNAIPQISDFDGCLYIVFFYIAR